MGEFVLGMFTYMVILLKSLGSILKMRKWKRFPYCLLAFAPLEFALVRGLITRSFFNDWIVYNVSFRGPYNVTIRKPSTSFSLKPEQAC